VTRIIAGSAGGRVLKVPSGGTRPTSDRVREAVFSQLEARLGGPGGWPGVVVLDLYAGSGALALEALSRGAERAVLVDSSRAAARAAAANAASLGLARRASVLCDTVDRALAGRCGAGSTRSFDLAFLDPPYGLDAGAVDGVLARLASGGLLEEQALVVVERPARGACPSWPAGWEPLAAKSYGQTAVHLARAASGRPARAACPASARP
jgi:16S rRNA (guanine966-N2)-methyltransferase